MYVSSDRRVLESLQCGLDTVPPSSQYTVLQYDDMMASADVDADVPSRATCTNPIVCQWWDRSVGLDIGLNVERRAHACRYRVDRSNTAGDHVTVGPKN